MCFRSVINFLILGFVIFGVFYLVMFLDFSYSGWFYGVYRVYVVFRKGFLDRR